MSDPLDPSSLELVPRDAPSKAGAIGLRVDPSRRLRHYLAARDVPCPKCKYNLRALRTNICPECGFGFDLASLCVLSRPRPSFLDLLTPNRAIVLLAVLGIVELSLRIEPSTAGRILAWPLGDRRTPISPFFLINLLTVAMWKATEDTDLPVLFPDGLSRWLFAWLPRIVAAMLAARVVLLVVMTIEVRL